MEGERNAPMVSDAATGPVALTPSVVARAQAGDAGAFEAIFEAYYPRIVSYCYRLVGEQEQAQDLAQDTFVKAYHALPRTGVDLNVSGASWTLSAS